MYGANSWESPTVSYGSTNGTVTEVASPITEARGCYRPGPGRRDRGRLPDAYATKFGLRGNSVAFIRNPVGSTLYPFIKQACVRCGRNRSIGLRGNSVAFIRNPVGSTLYPFIKQACVRCGRNRSRRGYGEPGRSGGC
jgi:hypothetical protein